MLQNHRDVHHAQFLNVFCNFCLSFVLLHIYCTHTVFDRLIPEQGYLLGVLKTKLLEVGKF